MQEEVALKVVDFVIRYSWEIKKKQQLFCLSSECGNHVPLPSFGYTRNH